MFTKLNHFSFFAVILFGCNSSADIKPDVLNRYLQDRHNSEMIDFSYAGYHYGESLPKISLKDSPVFHVDSFGAVPDDGIDDIDAIQRAVDAAESNGKGVVKFSKGTYDFDVVTARRYVSVKHSDIVILGAGEGLDGTTLYDHTGSWYHDESKKWFAGQYPSFFYIGKAPIDSVWEPGPAARVLTNITSGKKGALQIRVEQPNKLEIGTTCLITMEDDSLNTLLKELIFPLTKFGKNYEEYTGPGKYKFRQMVTINSIDGNLVTLDIPLSWHLTEQFNPKLWELDMIVEEVIIAGFHLKTDWNEKFYHHKNSTHDNGWDHIKIRYGAHCAVFSIIHENASSAVGLHSCKNSSLYDCQITGNPGHNGFVIGGFSTANLITRSKGGRQMHTFSMSGYSNANVFYYCFSDEPSAIDCHGSIAINNLFDNLFGPVWRHGGSNSAVPPVHGRGLTLWNWRPGYSEPYKGRIKDIVWETDMTPGIIAVGVHGLYGQPVYYLDQSNAKSNKNNTNDWCTIEYFGEQPYPLSLYEFQKEKRLNR